MDECVAVAVAEAVAVAVTEAVAEAVAEADQSIHDQSIHDPSIHPRHIHKQRGEEGHFRVIFFDLFPNFLGLSQECSEEVWASSKGTPARF